MNRTLEILIESINAQLFVLNQNGHAIYDADNSGYYISGIRYCSEDDKIKFDTVEDKNKMEE